MDGCSELLLGETWQSIREAVQVQLRFLFTALLRALAKVFSPLGLLPVPFLL